MSYFMKKVLFSLIILMLGLTSCQNKKKDKESDMENPFFTEWKTPFGVPPFDKIKEEHYIPAIKKGVEEQKAEIEVLIANTDEPTFENTILVLDKSGKLLDKVINVFFPLNSANTNDEMQAIARDVMPMLSKHSDEISMNPALFKKIKAIYEKRNELGLDEQQIRVTEKYYQDFERNGANLSPEDQETLKDINTRLTTLYNEFSENLLAETNKNFKLVIDNKEDLAGLPEGVIAQAASEAEKIEETGKWVFTLAKPSWIPFLQFSEKRELREKIYRAYFMRGDNDNENDNKDIIKKIVKLRDQKAKLMGFPDFASYKLDVCMAKTPENAYDLLMELWKPALEMTKEDVKAMQAIADRDGDNIKIESWDWWYYIEKLRKEKYDLDEAQLKPYFALENVKKGIFYVAENLYGLKFEKKDLPVYDNEVEAFEVKEADGTHLAILYMDFFPRDGKRPGAWSTEFRGVTYRDDERQPYIGEIVMNFTPPTGDKPALLTLEEVETLFHEFGHALHFMLVDGKYDRTIGSVPRDFVELPSQFMENYGFDPDVMKVYAKHYETGETIPDELLVKLSKSRTFNQGFITGEYVAAALLDLDYHTAGNPDIKDINQFEKEAMDAIGLIPEFIPRYRSTYFSHIFSGDGYSAGYYVYIWAAVLDSDAFDAFMQSGDIFNKEYAAKFRKMLEESGAYDGMEVYKRFRGQEPSKKPLLKKRGLI